MLFGPLQASLDQVDIPLGCCDAFLRFLLKCMQNVNHASKLDRVDSTIGIAIEVIDDLKDAATAKSFKRFGRWMLSAVLGVVDRLSHHTPDILRKFAQVVSRRGYPLDWLWRAHSNRDYSYTAITDATSF